jgi:hypothetical protein
MSRSNRKKKREPELEVPEEDLIAEIFKRKTERMPAKGQRKLDESQQDEDWS